MSEAKTLRLVRLGAVVVAVALVAAAYAPIAYMAAAIV
jgi:hypothetical protein